MAKAIKLPRMSDTMEEGTIVSWLVKEGDKINSGQMIAEVETDKATMELENYEKGTVLHLAVAEGGTVPVESILAIIGEPGEDYQNLLPSSGNNSIEKDTSKEKATETEKKEEVVEKTTETIPGSDQNNPDGRIFVSPLAKKIASEKGINLSQIKGSGENGRIIKSDVENYTPIAPTATSSNSTQESFDEIPVSQMRKTIARRLSESKFTAPHFYLTREIVMDEALKARAQMNGYNDKKVSLNDLVVKASAMALRQHPAINSAWMGDKIRVNHHIHVGVAVAVEDGLLVPVIRHADQKSLSAIGDEVRMLAGKAKNKELQPKDWEGNTFTISNLGMFGIDEFTAIINTPDSCILAVGGVKETVIVENGQMRAGHTMRVTLSCDHRVVDGVAGAQFLQTMTELLEQPVRLLV
jgi:pyruvate dehydrogenase E2 component (dihydrolipoamide acetyltransferase)